MAKIFELFVKFKKILVMTVREIKCPEVVLGTLKVT